MDSINKTALRAAILIHEQLAGGKCCEWPIYVPEYAWITIQRLRQQVDLARQRGWHRAAQRLTKDVAEALDDCRRQLESVFHALKSNPLKRNVASASDIFRDIVALEGEFEAVKTDLDEHELSVTTDRIVLEDFDLGPFEIRLDWRQLCSATPYRVVALDPHPAAKDEGVTHPHVQQEQLCEGDGREAIQAALAEGRLYDFLLLVSQLLHTYGRGSAYVELDNWDGTPCDDCGECVDAEDCYYCRHCGRMLCGNCSTTCQGCDESSCSGCMYTCTACGGDYCNSCLAECRACRRRFCEDCMEAGLCRSCHEKQHIKETHNDPPQNDAVKQPAGRSRRGRRRRPAAVPA